MTPREELAQLKRELRSAKKLVNHYRTFHSFRNLALEVLFLRVESNPKCPPDIKQEVRDLRNTWRVVDDAAQ